LETRQLKERAKHDSIRRETGNGRETQGHHAKYAIHSFPITHPEKILYPEMGISKQQLLEYYRLVAERMLPHVANRPLTLVRCPDGWNKSCFFQKHFAQKAPEGLRTVPIREKRKIAQFPVLDDVRGLFALAQMGVLEVHTWGSAADDPERPNQIVFDLDPDPSVEFGSVIECAQRLRSVFETAHLESFVKTTGGKGLHVCVPIEPDLQWDAIKSFAQQLAQELSRAWPDQYIVTQSKAQRRGKIYIDYLRNGRGATFIAPYSCRARANAPIAVPLHWDELDSTLRPDQYTLANIAQRLAGLKRDPFERMADLRQSLRPLTDR
jgi:bifunctional non-homologous end joining protein LigD